MNNNWTLAPLNELVNEILDRRGLTPAKLGSAFVHEGHRVISAKLIRNGAVDLAADEPRYVDAETYRRWMRSPLEADDVILTSEAPLGEMAYVTETKEWCLGQRLFGIRTKKERLLGRFLYYALQDDSVRGNLLSRATGTTAQGIRQAELRRVLIPVPSLPEQRAIAHILGTLDDKIELNWKMNATLDEIARTLFTSWFVDFDPVRAKAEGRQPEGMDAETAALFPDRFADSELGLIPEGWSVMALDEFGEVLGGGTPKTSEPAYWNGDIPWFSMADLPNPSDVFVIRTKKHITKTGEANSSAKMLPANTTILTARGTVGQVAMAGVSMAINQSCYGLFPRDGMSTSAMYYWTMASVNLLEQRAHGSVFATITRGTLKSIKIAVPSPELLHSFEAAVSPFLAHINSNLQENVALAETRDALLPELLSGRVQAPVAGELAGVSP